MAEPYQSSTSVSLWIAAARLGDQAASQALFERYFQRLVQLSQARVGRQNRTEDEEDAAIVGMFQFLSGLVEGKFPNVTDRNSLWPLLMDITIKASLKQLRKQGTKKRNDLAIRGESVFLDPDNSQLGIADFAVDQFNAEALVELEETVLQIREGLDELSRQIFDLKLQYYSNREIAKKLNRPSRTIDRKLLNVILPLVSTHLLN